MDIAIVGAGPIGSYIARNLGEKYNVTVFEYKKNFKKACSGLFSKRILNFVPIPNKIIEHKISEIEIRFPYRSITLKINPNLLVVNREKFNEYMFNLMKKFVTIKRKKVEKVDLTGKVYFSGSEEQYDYIIGTDGSLSVVRKSLGFKDPKFLLGIQFFTKEKDYSKKAISWSTKDGFFWKIPRGKRIEYGIMEKPERAKILFEKFVDKFNLKPKNIESALIPISVVYPKQEKIFLCGDSAGTVKPWSGGGIIWGLSCAKKLVDNFPNHKKYEFIMKQYSLKSSLYNYLTKIVKTYYMFLPGKIPIDIDWII